MKKSGYITIIFVAAIMFTAVEVLGKQSYFAKSPRRHYCSNGFLIWDAGGLSILNYRSEYGKRSNMFGGAFGVGYSYYWNKNFGILAGVEFALYQSKFNMKDFRDNYNTKDLDIYDEPENINFRYRLDNYEERQRLCNINIPLMAQYQMPLVDNLHFYAGLGIKIGIPVASRAKISGFNITSMGYYYDESGSHQVLNNIPELGFGEFSKKNLKSKIDFGVSCMSTVEAGVKWDVYYDNELYLGLYFDCSFNDVVKGNHEKRMLEYSSYNGNNFAVVNSALESQYAAIDDLHSFALSESPAKSIVVRRVLPLAFGIKVSFRVGLHRR